MRSGLPLLLAMQPLGQAAPQPAVPAAPPAPAAAVATEGAKEASAPEPEVVFAGESPLQKVFVVRHDGLVTLRLDSPDGNDQSAFDPKAPDRVHYEYVRLALVAPVLAAARHPQQASPRRALVVGLGGGTFVRAALAAWPRLRVDAVEIDGVVVDAARRHFALPATPRLQVHVADAALHLAAAAPPAEQRADVIFLDAFSGETIPPPLSTAAFFARVRAHLAPAGVVALNLALVTRAEASAIRARFAQAFPGCAVVAGRADDNVILLGGQSPVPTSAVRAAIARSGGRYPFSLVDDVDTVSPCPVTP